MKKLIVSALVAASALSAPGAVFTSTSASAAACGPDVPEAMRRPGGYCEQISKGESLVGPGENACPDPFSVSSLPQILGARVHVADASCYVEPELPENW